MAVQVDAVGPGATGTNGTSPLTWTHTASGTNRAVVVGVSQMDATFTANNVTATYDGTSMTLLGAVRSDNAVNGVALLFGLVNPPTGAKTVSVQRNSGSFNFIGGSISFTGVDQNTPFGVAVQTANDDTHQPTIAISSDTNDMVVDIFVHGTDVDGTTPSGLRWVRNVNSNTAAGNAAQSTYPGAASVTAAQYVPTAPDWWGVVAVNIKAVIPTPVPIGLPGYGA
jgi:hypothetical protein